MTNDKAAGGRFDALHRALITDDVVKMKGIRIHAKVCEYVASRWKERNRFGKRKVRKRSCPLGRDETKFLVNSMKPVAPEALSRLENHHVVAATLQRPSHREAGKTSTDDDNAPIHFPVAPRDDMRPSIGMTPGRKRVA